MKTLLVSLVSDQTIPNVQFIKEMKDQVSDYLFISTDGMEKKGTRKWIEKASDIKSTQDPIIVDRFSYDDIQQKLNNHNFEIYDKLIVNITGGTKVMTLATHNYFKDEGAEIYYVTGDNKKIIKVFPGKKKVESVLNISLSLNEYLTAYGFKVKKIDNSVFSESNINIMFSMFSNGQSNNYNNIFNHLRKYRNKGLKKNNFNSEIKNFISELGLVFESDDELTREEVCFVTGDWFEHYVFNEVKQTYNIEDDKIMKGVEFSKPIEHTENDVVRSLLNIDNLKKSSPKNELDIIFMHKGVISIIECKSSIISHINDGVSSKPKEINILGETIYKSDSLKTNFGLFAKSYIFTMTNLSKYISEGDIGAQNNKRSNIIDLINRATLSKITIVDGLKLTSGKKMNELL